MEILQTRQEYYIKINSLLKKKSEVKIATYNMYAGVLDDGRFVNDWGGKYFNAVGAMFDIMALKSCDVHIKVGVPRKSECPLAGITVFDSNGTKIDDDCAISVRNTKWDQRIEATKKRWWRFKFDLIDKSHIKLVLVSPNHCIFGGRNLSDSEDSDISFYVSDDGIYKQLLDIFNNIL